MAKNDDSRYPVGYKKPPLHTQFKPGRSGNVKGRPRKARTLVEVLMKELFARVTITERGKRKTVSKLEAMLKQHINKAAGGDARSVAIILNLLRFHDFDEDNIRVLVAEFRAISARHEAADRNQTRTTDDEEPNGADEQ